MLFLLEGLRGWGYQYISHKPKAQMQTESAKARIAKNIDRLSVGVFVGLRANRAIYMLLI